MLGVIESGSVRGSDDVDILGAVRFGMWFTISLWDQDVEATHRLGILGFIMDHADCFAGSNNGRIHFC